MTTRLKLKKEEKPWGVLERLTLSGGRQTGSNLSQDTSMTWRSPLTSVNLGFLIIK